VNPSERDGAVDAWKKDFFPNIHITKSFRGTILINTLGLR